MPSHHDEFGGGDDDDDDDYYDERGDLDSAYGDDSFIGDDTKTLSCYITDYRFEYGRRYHSYRDGAYWVCALRIYKSGMVRTDQGIDLGPQR